MTTRMFHRLLVANRGEVAARVARACDSLGIEPIFAVSEADVSAPYVEGRRAVCIGPPRSENSYLDAERLVQAAVLTRCSAVHPGWGFLAENPVFATLCESHGVTFVGPPAHVMQLMGTKNPAKRAMRAAGLDLIPGSDGVVTEAQARDVAERIGYPVLVKAESGGGGKGMRVARDAGELPGAYTEASAEARAAFGDPRVYIERLIEGGRHVEIQLVADRYGGVVHLGERDCTVQRNHQKLIEESPSPAVSDSERERTLAAAVFATRQIGYAGAGTMEFLQDGSGTLRFMEMNTRLQVEHPVSEVRTGVDLVAEQIRVAAGHRLSMSQSDVSFSGHAIECRINAEDPSDSFRPGPGIINTWSPPEPSDHIRVETHVRQGYEVPPFYDSLLCKVIASGADRGAAIAHMIEALDGFEVAGVPTTIPMHLAILRSDAFVGGNYDTGAIPGWPAS